MPRTLPDHPAPALRRPLATLLAGLLAAAASVCGLSLCGIPVWGLLAGPPVQAASAGPAKQSPDAVMAECSRAAKEAGIAPEDLHDYLRTCLRAKAGQPVRTSGQASPRPAGQDDPSMAQAPR
jgi:hypothetical protein